MSPLSRLRCRLISRTTITLATVGIATAVAPVGLAVATPMAASPAVAAVTQVLTVGAYADAHIQQATPSTNFGASTTLQADSGSGVTKRIYLKFVVSGVPADASLSVARLRMTATNSSGAVVSAKPGSHNNWSESGVKWSNAPVYGLRTDNSPAVTAGPVEWDLSSYVSGNGVYSVILTQASSTQTSFRSSESAQPPELELTYTTGVPSSDPVIVAAGDIACSTSDPSYNNGAGTATACRQRATSDLVLAQPSAAVLALGDLQYSLATLDQFTRSYDPAWGRVKSLTRPIPGNHEYAVANASGYYSYFGAIAGNPSLGYYSYDIGTWHLIALNSNCATGAGWRPGGCAAGSAQEQWLRRDLAARQSMHAGLLAPPALLQRPWRRRHLHGGSLAGPVQRQGRCRAERAFTRLRTVRQAEQRRHRRDGAGPAAVRGRHRRVVLHRYTADAACLQPPAPRTARSVCSS